MLNKLLRQIADYNLLMPGDHLRCAVSGGADSMALLWGMYLLRDKLKIQLSVVHFNHHLRAEESNRDEEFVKKFCDRYDIPVFVGHGKIVAGKKGLEAAARDARYAYFQSIGGKIATAHTANDNTETVLMHLIRGTGLKGLGGIAPVRGDYIRPMLSVTREEVLAFLEEYHVSYIQDSSNDTDAFLRNRLRHHVIPLLEQENAKLVENVSAMAMRLREDEIALSALDVPSSELSVAYLRELPQARRSRLLTGFLKELGVNEPEAEHISLAEALVFSDKPSARASFPGGVIVSRSYGVLKRTQETLPLQLYKLACPGITDIPDLCMRVVCTLADSPRNAECVFSVQSVGDLYLRSRQAGDTFTLSGGRKSLKKLFIDKKIPASERLRIPVVCDDEGIIGVYGFGTDRNRAVTNGPCVCIEFLQDS